MYLSVEPRVQSARLDCGKVYNSAQPFMQLKHKAKRRHLTGDYPGEEA